MYDDVELPDTESPVRVGEEVSVTSDCLAFSNDVGGTEIVAVENARVIVTRSFWDYETGWRFVGRLLDEDLIERNRAEGVSGFTAEHYRTNYPNNPSLADDAEKAAAAFDPAQVYFSEFDLAPAPAPVPGR